MTYLNDIGQYPVTASLDAQNALLSNISDQIVITFEVTIEREKDRMKNTCSLADIDFEFVLDSSGSIGSKDWETTTDLIAEHWIQEAIQPSGSQQCGNHVAIRRYSESDWYRKGHFFDLDFTPTNKWITDGFTNYTDYVADIFKQLDWIGSGTDTAGALERVRNDDIQKTRGGTTYIMVFSDGASNSFNDTVTQAEYLQPLVDEVFAFGIGDGRYPLIKTEKILQTVDNGQWIPDFRNYRRRT